MPYNVHNIHINGNCQDFILTSLNFNEENSKLTFSFVSKKETSKVMVLHGIVGNVKIEKGTKVL